MRRTLISLALGLALISPAAAQTPTFQSLTVTGPATVSGELAGQVTATGGTTKRTLADRAADELKVLDFGPSGAAVDRTGATDASAAIAATVIAACAASPVKSVFVPPGIYLFDTSVTIPAGCNRLTIYAEPGSAILKGSATNASNKMLFNATGNDFLKFYGLHFDGNSASSTNSNGLIGINGPMISPEFDHDVFTNSRGNAIWASAGANLIGTTAGLMNAGDTGFNLTGPVSGLKVGAYVTSAFDPDIYVTGIAGNTITLSRSPGQTVFANTRVRFTPAFTSSANAFPGDTTILTADTTGLAVGQTLQMPTSACLIKGTRITAVTANVSVTIDQTPVCKIPSGAGIAAAHGLTSLRITNSKFDRIGDGLATAGSATYTTNGSTASGASAITFNCISSKCANVGLIPGNLTAATGLPAGVPANDLVVDGPVVNNAASTFAVTLKAPVTQTMATGTAIPFQVGAISGNGYPLWWAYGAWFANTNGLIANNYFGHAWSSPLFFQNTQGLTLSHNVYRVDFQEFQSPTVAPSACIAPAFNLDLTLDSEDCSGATGNGIEADLNVNMKVLNTRASRNGTSGLFFCGGRGVQVIGGNFSNNGQYLNYPLVQQYDPGAAAGIRLGGSCTWGQPGTITDVGFTNVIASDYQLTHTQNYGVYQYNANATIANTTFAQMSMTGNVITGYDPRLDPNPPVQPPGVDNRITNPCVALDQATEGAQAKPGGNLYAADQWQAIASPLAIAYQRTSTTMSGCTTAMTMTVNNTNAPTAAQFNRLAQSIGVTHLTDLKFGQPTAKNLIVDFCAQASTAATYPVSLYMPNSARNRVYATTFTIAAANTPQCYSLSVPGDTVGAMSGVATNPGLQLMVDTGSGSNFRTATCNSWVDGSVLSCSTGTTLLSTLAPGQTLAITSVRLFPGTADATWVPRTDAAELALAQEYYTKSFLAGTAPAQNAGTAGAFCVQNTTAGGTPSFLWTFPQQMRLAPTITTYNPSAANANWRDITTGTDVAVTVNSDGLLSTSSVLISTAAPVAGIDTLCIHATASARF